jgi:hypothetical protein
MKVELVSPTSCTLLGLQELEECSVDCQPDEPCTHLEGFAHHIAPSLNHIQTPQGMYNERRDGDHESCAEGACTYGFTHDGVYYEAKHPNCFVSGGAGGGPDAATLLAAIDSLGIAAERGDTEALIAAAEVLRGRPDAVDGGSALQVYGCRGRVAGHIPITRKQYVMLTAVE